MKSAMPKVLHTIGGRPLVQHVLATLVGEGAAPIIVVVGSDMANVAEAAAPHQTVVQQERLGTGHAVLQAKTALAGFEGDVLVVFADTPFVTGATLQKMHTMRRAANGPALVVLGFSPADPGDYGRLIVGANGLERIAETKDATAQERAVPLCNSGIMLVDSKVLWNLLVEVKPNNAKGEVYLTDIVALARHAGFACGVVDGDPEELMGVNSRADLAAAEGVIQRRLRRAAMANGATLRAPETVYLSADTRLGRDVDVGPFTVFGPGVTVDDHAVIKGFCHIEGAHIAAGAVVGPYARIRPGTALGPKAHVGNFVELKNATLEEGAKVNHLSYVGDARVGARANVGAGTITANFDGFNKSHTDIGAGASIGSNSVLVAPVKIGDGAMTGAGAVVRKDVPDDALAVSSGRQETRAGFAAGYRKQKQAAKDKAKR